ncbi:MAG: nickel transporter [Desulfobacterales bacterium]|nr:MAG: nickel transporter [Desulfobacterales bacterium]
MKKHALIFIVSLVWTSTAFAHSVWINNFESHAHKPPHTMVSLGWGHFLPMDDILNSPNGRISVESFELYDPALNKTDLIKPPFEIAKAVKETANFDVFPADLAVQKVALKDGSQQGVYQFSLASTPSFYTQYIDKKGKERLQMKSRDQIKDIDRVLMSVKYQAFAKSYMTVGEWTNPKPLGHGLEIVPRTDLSNLRVGDMVEVDVLFYGKPLTATAKSMEYITAASNSFGQPDGFALFSYVMGGKAQFRVQSAGQWVISVNHKDDVTEDGPLKELYGKANQVYHGASLTFTVK